MLTKLKKPTCLLIAVCFSATTFALPVLANPGRNNGRAQQQNNSRQEEKKKPEQNNQNQPNRNEQKNPGQNNQNQSDRNEQKRPGQNNQNQPGRNDQKRPDNNNQPGRNDQKRPDNNNQPGRNNNKPQKQNFPRDNRRDNVVIKVVRGNNHDFDRARNDRLTLRDFIIAMYIAKQLGYNDYMPIYVMKKNGKPYKDICKAHGIKWGSVRRHVNNQHKTMNDDAVKLGLAIWALDDVLN